MKKKIMTNHYDQSLIHANKNNYYLLVTIKAEQL